ncbi:MAG: hypothetical protein JW820_07155, partial [Spirochaetales bacterium]|nr:hypothetical protein [Spirochaetales bacterium]
MRGSWFRIRRRKEAFAFLVVRFLRACVRFEDIYREFRNIEQSGHGFAGADLFARVRDLEEEVIFDVKEKAHALFRREWDGKAGGWPSEPAISDLERAVLSRGAAGGPREETRDMFAAVRRSLVNRSLDAYIGTGFHMFMILTESLYQLERYAPQYSREKEQVERLSELTRRMGYGLDDEEEHELDHIRQVARLSQGIAADTGELASIALERCRSLFRETAELIRHSIEEAGDNEVLVLNLLRDNSLLDQVYGPGAGEEILSHMFRGVEQPAASGKDKALAYA